MQTVTAADLCPHSRSVAVGRVVADSALWSASTFPPAPPASPVEVVTGCWGTKQLRSLAAILCWRSRSFCSGACVTPGQGWLGAALSATPVLRAGASAAYGSSCGCTAGWQTVRDPRVLGFSSCWTCDRKALQTHENELPGACRCKHEK